jgi:hypothetical protein
LIVGSTYGELFDEKENDRCFGEDLRDFLKTAESLHEDGKLLELIVSLSEKANYFGCKKEPISRYLLKNEPKAVKFRTSFGDLTSELKAAPPSPELKPLRRSRIQKETKEEDAAILVAKTSSEKLALMMHYLEFNLLMKLNVPLGTYNK